MKTKIHDFLLRILYKLQCAVGKLLGKGLPAVVVVAKQDGDNLITEITNHDAVACQIERIEWHVVHNALKHTKVSDVNLLLDHNGIIPPGYTGTQTACGFSSGLRRLKLLHPEKAYALVILADMRAVKSNLIDIGNKINIKEPVEWWCEEVEGIGWGNLEGIKKLQVEEDE